MKFMLKKLTVLGLLLAMLMTGVTGCGNDAGKKDDASSATEETADGTSAEEATDESGDATAEEIPAPEGYHLVWNDEFDGDTLNEDDWNREEHEVGWVNHELQEYVPSDEFAFVKDGELIIQPKKEESNGTVSYKSGRVNTQNKHDIKYGRIEARLRVPQGTGFLPAFWMMPQDEEFYGQWPKCGEIDIMEVLGNSTNVNYGTLHYGEPHKQNQGTYNLSDGGDFATDYHTFAIEWEPGVIRWFVDDEQYYETSDWFTAVEGEEEKPYPAPFNQPFHVILNVAVGGDWPGDPDDSTPFDDRGSMHVDYVRMFQKDSYDENVTKPEKVVNIKEADETGNFITNGDFTDAESLDDDESWKFLLFNGGEGAAEIRDGELIITSSNAGTEEYSVQVVQPGMPMEEGSTYRFSFKAKADEARTMKVAVTAPEVDWVRYFPDTEVELKPKWKKYSFEFKMNDVTDYMGRVEFNMGKTDSTATIHIKGVRLEKV